MKNSFTAAGALAVTAMLSACSSHKPPEQAPRPVRAVELRYDNARQAHRYASTVQSRYEVNQAFRVAGKVAQRKVDVGQFVHEGDVLAVLDDNDFRLAQEAARQAWTAAATQARLTDSDQRRLSALKTDGSVSSSDDERAQSSARQARANADAAQKNLELAQNRVNYTVLRASRSGLVTSVAFEVGQVVPEGQPMVSIADPGSPELVVDVPEDQLATFKAAHFRASLASAPNDVFDVTLRELSPQAAAQTRTYRARLNPVEARALPLGATATLQVDRVMSGTLTATIPATALTQDGGRPAVWVVKHTGKQSVGTVELVCVTVQGYQNDDVLIVGPPAGDQVVTAGVQKMAPGLQVALPGVAEADANTVATQ
ncbi:efflux RND transporter periplasmic adaptor subunit [Dyella sp. Tek66A03]|uniref:efflux RND transporter periplasmic adaptor subunit n=1 Tax=Dyella sp. Tek66A03 TaxID=3458298 RepID=UPI00403EB029